MKKFAITLIVILLTSVYIYAQDCRQTPFQPIFGVPDNTDTVGWRMFSNVAPGSQAAGANPSFWNFRIPEGQTNFVAFLHTQSALATQVVTLATPCISFDRDKTHALSFTFVGLVPGFMNRLSVYLFPDDPRFSDDFNPFTATNPPSNYRLEMFEMSFGTSELRLLITPEHFSQIAGSPESFRLIFRSQNASRNVDGTSSPHVIQSYLKDIVISEAQNHKLQVVAMTNPLPNCNFNNQILAFNVRNSGYATPATYNVCFRFSTDNAATFSNPYCQAFTTSIPFDGLAELRLDNLAQSFDAQLVLVDAWVEFSEQRSDTLRTSLYQTATQTTPYNISFDDPVAFRNWTIVSEKTTQSDITWHVPMVGNAMSGQAIIVTSGAASNDRLVSGCIELEANTRYQISFTYSALVNPNLNRPGSTVFSTDPLLTTSENLRLSVGRSNLPSDSDITLMDLRGFNNTDERTITTYFTPTESGTHFFGFLAYSDALSAGISISSFTIIEAPEPRTMPVFMSFESYDNDDGWQMFSHNAIDNTTGNLMRGWARSSTAAHIAHGGSVGLNTISSPAIVNAPAGNATSVITRLEANNNWLISPPIFMEKGEPVEIRYFRRSSTANAGEILNIRVSEIFEIDSLYRLEPLHRDTINNNQFTAASAEQRVVFTPTRTGVHFVTFQYNSPNNRAGGMSLDEISIQCSARAQEVNLSVIGLTVPPPACVLSNWGNETILRLHIKNRTSYTIQAGSLVAWFRIVSPQGDTTIRTGSHNPASGVFPQILPYRRDSAELRFDMRAVGTWEVKAWFSGAIDQNSSDDTSAIMLTASTGEHIGRYDMRFEPYENLVYWRNSQVGNPRFWWNFVNNPAMAHSGVGAAFIAPSGTFISPNQTVEQFITSPCLRLSQDTTYLVSFFLRKAEEYSALGTALNPVTINTYIGMLPTPTIADIQDSVVVGSMEYRQHSFFFRPSTTGMHYVILEAISSRLSTGVFLDNFVIVDSVTAVTPNASLNRIWVASSNTCDLSDDTLYVELANNGLVPIVNPRFSIAFGGQTFPETWQGTVPADSAVIIRLNRRLTHASFGEMQVTVTLNVDGNLATEEQTRVTANSIKTEPIRPPFTINFQSAEESELLMWNNLPQSLDDLLQPTFEYWSIDNNGAFFRPNHQRLLPGILASKCFRLQAGDPYVIIYDFRGTSVASPENLHVQIERPDGTIETLYTNSDIRSTSFIENAVQFEAFGNTGLQTERIRFLSNYSALATGIYIRSFTIKADTASWPADAELIRLISPRTDTALTAQEPVTIEIANINRRPLFNLPVSYSIDGGSLYWDTVPALLPGQTIQFTFAERANLGAYREYEIVVFVDAAGDINRTNDTIRKVVRNYQSTSLLDLLTTTQLKIHPNPATTEVFIQSEQEISVVFIYDMRGQLIREIRVNNTEYHLNTSDFPAGIYVFTIVVGNERVSKRIIIND